MEKREKTYLYLNRNAVKKFALKVAAQKRAGKFTRVGDTFLTACEAAFEAKARSFGVQFEKVSSVEYKFVTPHGRHKVCERLELLAANIVEGKVMSHPTIGKTLKD